MILELKREIIEEFEVAHFNSKYAKRREQVFKLARANQAMNLFGH